MQSPDTALAAFASDPSVSTFTILNDNYTVPSVKTTYYKACVNVSVSTSHAIAFEHILVDASKPYTVHHFILRAHRSSDCNDAIPDQVWGWAPGIDVLIFPSVAGVRIGSSGDANTYVSLEMETHFDNPTFAANEIDNSGVRVYYTSNLRQHDVGVVCEKCHAHFIFRSESKCFTRTLVNTLDICATSRSKLKRFCTYIILKGKVKKVGDKLFVNCTAIDQSSPHRSSRSMHVMVHVQYSYFGSSVVVCVTISRAIELIPGEDLLCLWH